MGKNLARKAIEQRFYVVCFSLFALNHCLAFSNSENGKRWSKITSLGTPLIVKVLQISRKCCKCALASS
jgi:hypothetical protein